MTYVTCPTLPVPPGGRRPAGRDPADPVRRPVHPRPRRGGEPQRARRRRRLAGRPTSARRCWSRRSTSSATSSTATATPTSAASTSTSSRPSSGTSRRSGCRSASPSPGKQSCEIAGELADVMIAVEPKAELGEMFDAAGGAGKPRIGQMPISFGTDKAAAVTRAHTPVPLVRPRLEGQRRAARPAGLRRGQPVRPRGGRRRRASRAGTTSTPSSRPRRSTPTPASPTWPWCRSAATSRCRSSSGARRR